MKQINTHTVHSVICGHDKSAPYSGCTWVNVNNPQRTFRRRRGPIHRARPHRITTNYCALVRKHTLDRTK